MLKLDKARFFTILFLLSLLSSTSVNSQNDKLNIDSLYNVLKVQPNSTEKVDALISLYKKSIKQRSIRKDVLDDALLISEEIYYIKGIGICYNRKGITARYDQDYSESVMYHKRALSFLEKTTDTFYITKCLNSLGVTYRKLNLEKEAFESYFKSLKLAEKINNKRSASISLNGIGNIFLNTEQYDKALYYFKKALVVEKEIQNTRGQEYDFANIGEVYLHKKQYDSTYHYFNKSLALALKNPRKESLAIKYTLFGLLHQSKGEYQKSIDYYQKALPALIKYKNTRYLSKSLLNIGINQLHLKQYDKAYTNIIEGLQGAKKIKSKENITLGYQALVDYYSLTNDYKNALLAHKNAKTVHDSIVNEASQKSIISTQIAYETQEKDVQIQQLAKENEVSEEKAKTNYTRLLITGIISFISIVFLLISLYLYRKNSDLELQHKNSELQHYLFQINELKDQAKHNAIASTVNFSQKFEEFNLSAREIEVLTHISNGLNNEEISQKMFVSKNTIKTHISHIYTKLDVRNRVQAIQKIIT